MAGTMPRKVGAFAKVCGRAWRPVAVICLLVYLAVNQMIFNLGWLEREKGNRCAILRPSIMLDTRSSLKPPRCLRGGFLIWQFVHGTCGLLGKRLPNAVLSSTGIMIDVTGSNKPACKSRRHLNSILALMLCFCASLDTEIAGAQASMARRRLNSAG